METDPCLFSNYILNMGMYIIQRTIILAASFEEPLLETVTT